MKGLKLNANTKNSISAGIGSFGGYLLAKANGKNETAYTILGGVAGALIGAYIWPSEEIPKRKIKTKHVRN